jgi:elongation factor P--(R)-beta-lysine ligase
MNGSDSNWRPTASLEALKARARLMAAARVFFDSRGVMEVSTPALSAAAATDPQLASLRTGLSGRGARWLHTSPEFPMKRLLAAGAGDIYQLCTVFRDGETGRWHNPEFKLLEWYRLGFDDRRMAEETAELIACLLAGSRRLPPPEFVTYRDAFLAHAGIDPLTAGTEAVVEAAIQAVGTGGPTDWTRADWLDLLGSARVYPALGRGQLTVLTDYPVEQAALARLKPGDPPTAARFEVFLDGLELANGFHELGDVTEQGRRFEAENEARRARGLPELPVDRRLLAALAHGLPDCAGVALGFDRLVALAIGARHIDEVLPFPDHRA